MGNLNEAVITKASSKSETLNRTRIFAIQKMESKSPTP